MKIYIKSTRYIGGIDSGRIQDAATAIEEGLLDINSWADVCDEYGNFDLDKCESFIVDALMFGTDNGTSYFTIGDPENLNLGDEFVESCLYKLTTIDTAYDSEVIDGNPYMNDSAKQYGFLYIGVTPEGFGCTGVLGLSGNLVGEGYNLLPDGLYREEELIKPWSRGYLT